MKLAHLPDVHVYAYVYAIYIYRYVYTYHARRSVSGKGAIQHNVITSAPSEALFSGEVRISTLLNARPWNCNYTYRHMQHVLNTYGYTYTYIIIYLYTDI